MSFKIVYNGYEIDNTNGVKIYNMAGVDSVEIRTSEDYLTGTDGGAIWEQFYGMRTITLEGSIVGDDASDYFAKKAQLVEAFSLNGEKDLTITRWDGTHRKIPARTIGMPDIAERRDEPSTYCTFQVQLRCPTPFFQDDGFTSTIDISGVGGYPVGQWTEVEEEDGEFDTTTGMPIETPVPFTNDFVDINVLGQVNTNPVYEIHGNITNPSVRNITTGQFFSVNTTVSNGEILTVQLQDGVTSARKNGANMINFFNGHFIPLVPGVNTLRLTGSTFSGGVKCDVTYRNNYLSL